MGGLGGKVASVTVPVVPEAGPPRTSALLFPDGPVEGATL